MRVRAASDPVWAVLFDPRSGRLDTCKSVKLLLRPFRPDHKNEITAILRLADFEEGRYFSIITLLPSRLPHDMLAGPRMKRALAAENQR